MAGIGGQNHTCYEGDEFTWRFYLRERDEQNNDVGPLDLTGMLAATWRLSSQTPMAMTIFGPAVNGVLDVAVLDTYTTGLGGAVGDHVSYPIEVKVTDSAGISQVAATGKLTVRGSQHDEP